MMYQLDQEQANPVLLDIDSMKNNVILLLDTFFYITIWKGETIVKWEDARYQDDPSYENFKVLLEQPIEDAKYIMGERFPMPRFFICKPGDSNERKIKNRVNPSSLTANNATVEVRMNTC
jgi:protein transport protein SEC23